MSDEVVRRRRRSAVQRTVAADPSAYGKTVNDCTPHCFDLAFLAVCHLFADERLEDGTLDWDATDSTNITNLYTFLVCCVVLTLSEHWGELYGEVGFFTGTKSYRRERRSRASGADEEARRLETRQLAVLEALAPSESAGDPSREGDRASGVAQTFSSPFPDRTAGRRAARSEPTRAPPAPGRGARCGAARARSPTTQTR